MASGFYRFPDRRFPNAGSSQAERWQGEPHIALAMLLHRCSCSIQELSPLLLAGRRGLAACLS